MLLARAISNPTLCNSSYPCPTNEITAAGINKLAEEMEIKFLTHSLYENTSK